MNIRSIGKFHKTRVGHLLFGLVELGISIFCVNVAIGSGDWWQWLLGVIFLVGFLQNMGRMIIGAKQ